MLKRRKEGALARTWGGGGVGGLASVEKHRARRVQDRVTEDELVLTILHLVQHLRFQTGFKSAPAALCRGASCRNIDEGFVTPFFPRLAGRYRNEQPRAHNEIVIFGPQSSRPYDAVVPA